MGAVGGIRRSRGCIPSRREISTLLTPSAAVSRTLFARLRAGVLRCPAAVRSSG